MSFSAEVKEELSKINNLANKEQVKAEFMGYLMTVNVAIINNKIKFSTENEYNINRFSKLASNLNLDYDIQIQGKVFSITLKKYNNFDIKDLNTPEQKKALIRGIFLGSGSINNPKYNYHLEIILKDSDYIETVNNILMEYKINAKTLNRKKGYSLYLKDGEEISKILALMGANSSVIKYEEIRVVKETRNNINRIVNCETANLNKTVNAAIEQIEAINIIKKSNRFDTLPENLKEVANLRLEFPEASLTELGQKLSNPIGKSGVNHRLKKLIEIARRVSMKQIGIYIHIPFCIKKCYYCDFISYPDKKEFIEKYIDTLIQEIKSQKKENIVKTIYIGGGTPSCISEKYIEKIIKEIKNNFNVIENAEITIEINPGTVNEEKIKYYKKIGINRISIGMQSCNDKILKKLGRIHSFEQFKNTYKLARKSGFNNINIDAMIGLPNQTLKDIDELVKNINELKPEHVSVYSLILEEGTILEDKIAKNEEILPEEDLERTMYWNIKKELEKLGYIHYEISNFSKKGYESKHNSDCWNQEEYLGFGVAAHSYYDRERFSNENTIEKYINNYKSKIIHEKQSTDKQESEYMLLGLRKIKGISIEEYKHKFEKNPLIQYKTILEKLREEGLIDFNEQFIYLTNKGIDLANLVWQEFI